ncbi:MAG: preprotein translocase subunit SecE [Deltaproteobacteria bacterium]|nr:MAG: preprotein translocase subunit SecE [Deltaproteobacteria bacterium]RLB03455.1 MAG: preprotein translocase subunit SecE [Deltaproteobacteria bacterium]
MACHFFHAGEGEEGALKERLGKVFQFLKEVRAESRRVTWASRREIMAATAVVLIVVFLSALYLGIVDLILSALIRVVLG